jgi:hypothetical protein
MAVIANRISQPGWTGNVGALGTLKTVQRASPVGPIGHYSMAASVRIVDSLVRRSTVRISPPVSVGLRTIETGGANLVQRQSLRAFARVSLDAKVHKTASTALDRSRSSARARSAADAKSIVQGRHVELVRIFGSACPAVGDDSRVVERYRPSATGASSGLTLNALRIVQDRRNRVAAERRKRASPDGGAHHEMNRSHQV